MSRATLRLCIFSSLLGLLACQSESVDRGPSTVPTASAAPTATTQLPVADAAPVTDASAGPCNLQSSGITFPDAGCHACMQTSCCDPTAACFGSAGCSALYSCINACPSRGLPSDAGAALDGGDAGDGGDSCVAACEAQHGSDVAGARAYIQCYAQHCLAACR